MAGNAEYNQGIGFGQAMKQAAGYGFEGLAFLDSLRRPGGIGQFFAQRAQVAQDPAARAGIQGSPLLSAFYGYGGENIPRSDPNAVRQAGMTPEQAYQAGVQVVGESPTFGGPPPPRGGIFRANLPALEPETAVKQQIAQTQADVLQRATPQQREAIGLFQLGIPSMTQAPPGFRPRTVSSTGAMTFEREPPSEPDLVPVPGSGGRLFYSPTTGKTSSVPLAAGAQAEAQADVAAQMLGFGSSRDPAYRRWVAQQAGLTQAPAPAPVVPEVPTQVPQLPQVAPQAPQQAPQQAAPPTAFQQLPGNTPVDQLPFVQYPSPAFLDDPNAPVQVAQAAPAPAAPPQAPAFRPGAGAPAAAPAAPPPPPGTTSSMRLGPLSIRRQGAPAQGKAVSAVMARQLASAKTAANAAGLAIEILKKGPQSPFTIAGQAVGTPPSFVGPVSGRVLSGLGKVSGQPLAVEQAQLAAYFAHARSGVFSIIGQRPNEETLAMFDPLMPNVNQPTEIALTHLERLQAFYEQLADMEAGLANLSPDQRLALIFPLFQKMMTSPGPSGEPPPVIDLR